MELLDMKPQAEASTSCAGPREATLAFFGVKSGSTICLWPSLEAVRASSVSAAAASEGPGEGTSEQGVEEPEVHQVREGEALVLVAALE
jgi:hypothetical protein